MKPKKVMKRVLALVVLLSMILTSTVFMASATPNDDTAALPAVLDEQNNLKVMSFNVLDVDTSTELPDGTLKYPAASVRSAYTIELIKTQNPDILGIQEAGADYNYDWVSTLKTALVTNGDYECKAIHDQNANVAPTIGKGLIIFYKRDRFEYLDGACAPYVGDSNRYYQWVKLTDTETNKPFYVYNTHLSLATSAADKDNPIKLAQKAQLRYNELCQLMDTVRSNSTDAPFVMTGDFNMNFSDKLDNRYNYGTAQTFVDINYDLIRDTELVIKKEKGAYRDRLDHIFYNNNQLQPTAFEAIATINYHPRTNPNDPTDTSVDSNTTIHVSDHNAIMGTFAFKTPIATVTSDMLVGGKNVDLRKYKLGNTYYVECLTKTQEDVDVNVRWADSNVKFYADPECTVEVEKTISDTNETTFTITGRNTGSSPVTYLDKNRFYFTWGEEKYMLDLRVNNYQLYSNYCVDAAFAGRDAGTTALYADKWYTRPVIIGTNGFATIQEAVNAAPDGATILVAPGTYKENVTINTGRSLHILGENRTGVTALKKSGSNYVISNNRYVLNPKRDYETYIDGGITYVYPSGDNLQKTLEINGLNFIGTTPTGQIRVTGGNVTSEIDLQIHHNVFNCHTTGSIYNGSAVHGNTKVQKTGHIEDNYFELDLASSLYNDAGQKIVNRAITIRNLKDFSINCNAFVNYFENAIYISSEVESGNTSAGYGNIAFTNNELRSTRACNIYINNIYNDTDANVQIGGNRLTTVEGSNVNSNNIGLTISAFGARNVKDSISATITTGNQSIVNVSKPSDFTVNYVNSLS